MDFFITTLGAISKIRGPAHIDLRFDCLINCGLYFYRSGSHPNAIAAARLANDLADRSNNKIFLRKANTLQGIVHAECGDVAESVVRYASALEYARDLGDLRSEGAVLVSLSTALNYGALYHDALNCAQRGRIALQAAGNYEMLVAAAYTNMAQSLMYLEDYPKGFEVIQEALRLSRQVRDAATAFSMCIREYTYVQIALELEELELAREHSILCRQHSKWGDNQRCRILADITAGLCEIKGGDVARGFEYLESSLSQSSDYSLRIDALTALVKAHDELGRPEMALQYMKELLAAVRQVRSKGIFSLMALSGDPSAKFYANQDDMRVLELREAKLEAKVAKREVFHSRMEMLERLAIAADLKEEDSGEHGYRVGRLAALLAADLGWEPDACSALEMAARLHDIGKVGVPDRILFNSEKLREAEREFITTHTIIGSEMLAKSDIPHLRVAQEIALHHHEWWNGEGYPSKLRGNRIPLHARIVALADVFDALTHGRPFAQPWSADRALAEIRLRRGTQFDPDLADRFLTLIERLIREQPDLDDYLGKAGRNSPFLQARTKIRRLLAEKHENEARTPALVDDIHI